MVGAALCTADFFLEFSSCYLEELAEEALDPTQYLLNPVFLSHYFSLGEKLSINTFPPGISSKVITHSITPSSGSTSIAYAVPSCCPSKRTSKRQRPFFKIWSLVILMVEILEISISRRLAIS